jgi:hypothetical protein
MNICHLVFAPDTITYLATRASVAAGHTVHIGLADPDRGRKSVHKVMQRIARLPGVHLFYEESDESLPDAFERLVVQVFPRPTAVLGSGLLGRMAARARKVTLVTAGDRSRHRRASLQMQWQEIRSLARWAGKIDRVVYKDGFYPIDLFGLLKPRHVTGFDIHSMFMDDQAAFARIQELNWAVEMRRPILINFMGSQDPARRKIVLDSIRATITQSIGSAAADAHSKRMLWHEYSDAQPGALGMSEFVDALTDSDFTLCPPGYSLITHRPVEAMLRGSIPVLHASELDLYDIELTDGVNCIAVESQHWPKAVERCRSMDERSVVRMRANIRDIAERKLAFAHSSMRTRRNFGVEASEE